VVIHYNGKKLNIPVERGGDQMRRERAPRCGDGGDHRRSGDGGIGFGDERCWAIVGLWVVSFYSSNGLSVDVRHILMDLMVLCR
jgi:hypothetical protein